MKVLVVEDDQKIADVVSQNLRSEGFTVDHAKDGEEAQVVLQKEKYNLIILDLMLPFVDGLTVLKEFRERGGTTPVIILSAKHTVDDRIEGLKMGGDDYLVKPFSVVELLLRVQRILRLTNNSQEVVDDILQFENLEVNIETREVTRAGIKIELPSREFSLLVFMMKNVGKILTKAILLEKIWNYNFDPQTNVVDVLVCKLRAKVDKEEGEKIIQTIRGVGYVFGKR